MEPSGANCPLGWQEGKSALDCHRHMLEHRVATDVCFLVGSSEGGAAVSAEVHAHKYMLIARSTVFEAMFCGAMTEGRTEGDVIRVPDIDPQSFNAMLRYIYYDSTDISATKALSLMYAAKKYMLTGLVKKCQEILESTLNVSDVCAVLEQSILLDEHQLTRKCLAFIGEKFQRVVKTKGFQALSRDSLAEVIALDVLAVPSELDIYQSCVDWARNNFELHCESSTGIPTDVEIRTILGKIIFRIRFPTMDPAEFARCVGLSDVLTPSEKNLVYYYMITKEAVVDNSSSAAVEFPFNTTPRELLSVTVERFTTVSQSSGWNCTGPTDAIDFKSSIDLRLSGIGVYGGPTNAFHNVAVEILRDSVVVQRTETRVKSDGTATPIKIALDTKVAVDAGITYTISATIVGQQTFYGTGGRPTVPCGKGMLTFTASSLSANQTNHRQGQIPEIYC